MLYQYIKDLDAVKREMKEQHDKAITMRYAVKAFIDSLKGYEDKPITQRALQEYYYKNDKLTRYVIGEDDYITFSLGKDYAGRRELSIHGKHGCNYEYYKCVALAYEISLYDGETYKTWGDVINKLNEILDNVAVPEYDEAKIEKEYAKCKAVADAWNALADDKDNIWNMVEGR